MSEALVFSIEEFSVFDGPGIRTTVFLSGCPMHCEWCHNPEGQSFKNSIVRSINGCIDCGECMRRAKNDCGKLIFTEEGIENCPRNLLRYVSKSYTSEELCAHLSKNFTILNGGGGGITFSGGEPLANAEFLIECLDLTAGKVNRAVQTSGYAENDVFKKVLDGCDYMLFDLKLADEELHERYTGVSNRKIMRNFATLAESGKNFVVRMPMIPTVTDTEDNVRLIAEILRQNDVNYIELLPYNRLAGAKYPLVGREYKPSFDGDIEPKMRLDIFAEYGVKAVKL